MTVTRRILPICIIGKNNIRDTRLDNHDGLFFSSTRNTTGNTVVCHHTDHLGGAHVETDENEDAVEYIIYSPFGGAIVDEKTGAYENKHKYTGKEKEHPPPCPDRCQN